MEVAQSVLHFSATAIGRYSSGGGGGSSSSISSSSSKVKQSRYRPGAAQRFPGC
jgi:hypothetical protein